MKTFIVTLKRGGKWDGARSMRQQDAWDEHAAFMDALVRERFVVLGGPIASTPDVMLIVRARDEQEIHAQLALDPWSRMGLLETTGVQPWEILLGKV